MEKIKIKNIELEISRVGLGTWAIGGWMWGGTDENESIKTIHKALDSGINLIDTAPAYGFGKSEEIVGKAVKESGSRDKIVIATKTGISWKDGEVFRDASKEKILQEIDESLRRLQTDYIDIYQVHWPDPKVPVEETAEAMNKILESGKIKAIGLSNFSTKQIDEFRKAAPVHTLQPPYNMFERDIEDEILPYCNENKIKTITYGSLCRGLLSGRMSQDTKFEGDDLRKQDPKFQQPLYDQYLEAVEKLKKLASDTYHKEMVQLAVRWALDQGADAALWGARHPEQIEPVDGVWGWKLENISRIGINNIINLTISDKIDSEFMAPSE